MSTSTRRQLSALTALRLGRTLLLTDGWTQKHYAELVSRREDGEAVCKRCAYGALEGWTIDEYGTYNTTVGYNDEASKYLKQAMFSVDDSSAGFVGLKEYGWESIGIAQWNDVEGRTAEQVIKAFDKAIELAEAEAK